MSDADKNPKTSFADKMRVLREQYLERLKSRRFLILDLWQGLHQEPREDRLQELFREVHTIAGSSGTFGYHSLSLFAKELEAALKEIQASPEGEWPIGFQGLSARFMTFAEVLQAAIDYPEGGASAYHGPAAGPSPRRDEGEATKEGHILLVEDDQDLAESMAAQLGAFGYRVELAHSAEEIPRAFAREPLPEALVIDIILPEGDTAGPDAIAEMHKKLARCAVPVIYISARDDTEARLAAVRGCGSAYLTKPVDIGSLVEWLDRLTQRVQDEPYRVLIVDDDLPLAGHHALLLENAGIRAPIIADPMDLVDELREFNPDLVLMDMYMPGYMGSELARLIRQTENFMSIPIIYVSTERAESVQLHALLQGGDDFLTKPVQMETLIRVVEYRAERFRQMRALMVRDSLTRLLNHRNLKESAEYETKRARREQRPLSLLMIDVDHFKRVNDDYGHGAGDQVLKTIARYLKQRLRTTDIVGRYGGEEFAALLPDTPHAGALGLADELREGFSRIEHRRAEQAFNLTFSVGVATTAGQAETADALFERADQALYAAKAAGRNRVMGDSDVSV